MKLFRLSVAVTCMLVIAAAARADTIIFKNGMRLSGRIIKENDREVVVELPYGQMTISRERIAHILREPPHDYYLRQAAGLASEKQFDHALLQVALAKKEKPDSTRVNAVQAEVLTAKGNWLLERGMSAGASMLYRQAKVLAPGQAAADDGLRRATAFGKTMQVQAQAASQHLAAGRPADAIKAFDRLLTRAPEWAERVQTDFSRALGRVGLAAFNKQKFAEAAGFFARALAIDPKMAPLLKEAFVASHLNAAAADIKLGLYTKAEGYVGAAVSFAPENAHVQYYLGVVLEKRSKKIHAGRAYRSSLERAGKPAVAGKLSTAVLRQKAEHVLFAGQTLQQTRNEAEWARVEKGRWQTIKTRHFTIHHHNKLVGARVAASTEAWFDRIMDAFGLPESKWGDRADIFIYANKQTYIKEFKAPAWSGGMANVQMRGNQVVSRRFASWQTSKGLTSSVLPHELTHLVVHSTLRYSDNLPIALHEGIAVYMEPAFSHRYHNRLLKRIVGTELYIPLETLLTLKTYPENAQEVFYAQSYLLVKTLIERGGTGGISLFKKFIGSVESLGAAGAVRRYYGVTLVKLEKKLKSKMRAK